MTKSTSLTVILNTIGGSGHHLISSLYNEFNPSGDYNTLNAETQNKVAFMTYLIGNRKFKEFMTDNFCDGFSIIPGTERMKLRGSYLRNH